MRLLPVAMLAAVVVCGVAQADDSSNLPEDSKVQTFYTMCKTDNDLSGFRCGEYLVGVSNMMQQVANGGDVKLRARLGMCSSKPISIGAMIQAYENWTEKHPEKWDDSRITGVVAAFSELWPCK